MSVAFRRESDDEHLEPKFERPIPPGPNLVTARGLAQLSARVAEVEALIATLQDEEALKAARRDLRYWSTRLATAQVMPAPAGDVVEFGSTVTLVHSGRERTITLVGDDEADPAAGLLAFSAPLARAIMGAEAGEYVDFGGKAEAVEIVTIT
ncbi:transcription elongation GreA/GreB family factor [Novosphingobium capsulatum]|uniref:Transcription elongation GreA/GreB family factor n=1 Tax=Novosphingobium capsulatum TaxID=13688 RepID=A0ABU1MI09_9SPHN|nr:MULTISPECIES: GreA/GreB family elongation factor [Novosphingobium]MDR6509973.1 transcription elongation GreA/GreB family factor [Novosphingobium capsulatum]PTR11953.1 transcription elongation GreA/GreB family factor [Novosphingobium sp. GV055]PUB04993.1 transcription elongation GreA/GreB family factor [Novosphingobium sp. GV061]PUB21312.1 transcription elongation GreA/GreB family factor [Novosphingobium sp. GV079]PUB43038.1 transcription elongation GreA/GreB family factor [Novosphingobium s